MAMDFRSAGIKDDKHETVYYNDRACSAAGVHRIGA
jgi:hypothetical protein